MSEEYTRTELLIGREGMERLRNASVLVFGVGGGRLPLHRSTGKKRRGPFDDCGQ